MKTFLVRAYVTGFGNMHLHRTSGQPIKANIRLASVDAMFDSVTSNIQSEPFFHMAAETNPRIFAFDLDQNGEVLMRLPNSIETHRGRFISAADEVEQLCQALGARGDAQKAAARIRAQAAMRLRAQAAGRHAPAIAA